MMTALSIMSLMPTALVHHPIYEKHDTGVGHPECPARYVTVLKHLRDDPTLWNSLVEIEDRNIRRTVRDDLAPLEVGDAHSDGVSITNEG